MRVIHILDHSIPFRTEYSARTILMLEQQKALGWETYQLTGPNHDAGQAMEEQVEGWHFYRTPQPGGILQDVPALGTIEYIGEIAYRMETIAKRVRPHILHAHPPILNVIPALRVGGRLGIPVVYEMRPLDGMPGKRGHQFGSFIGKRSSRGLETWVLKHVDAITTVCEAIRADIVARGIPAAKVTAVPITPERLPAGDGEEARNAGGAEKAKSFGAGSYRDAYAHLVEVAST